MYKIVNGIEKIHKEDLVLVTEDGRTRGHEKKIRMRQRELRTDDLTHLRALGRNTCGDTVSDSTLVYALLLKRYDAQR
ncbi:hypothetical protein E2C01_025790 [Portunus trituberculatus]|uniref:Uncharacterized protein n=1 Tax=Portunus trituberculatus TaxID=210409 RepID=A0A5B7EGW4_PORTR|nr:hypothetical protein [Portunus trituberculatus]